MSLNFGRQFLAIPGPSVFPDRVLNAMHQPTTNIYGGDLIGMTETLFPDLRKVARTEHEVAIYIANGHGAWEASLRNTLVAGDKVLVITTGKFGPGWAAMAETHGIDVQILDFGMQGDADPDQLEAALRDDVNGEIKAVLTVQTDTASSVKNDIPALRKAIDAANHDALFMVDCIASLACDRFEMDAWGVDLMVAGCQKGLMTPPGISFVYFNPKARKARERANPGQYFDWNLRIDVEIYYQYFCGTCPTQHIFGLREALDMLLNEEGLEAAWNRHEQLASAVWAAIDAWGDGTSICHNIADPSKRSVAVSTVNTGVGEAAKLRQWAEFEGGTTLGVPLGFDVDPDNHFRIGHMGHLNIPMILGTLGAIDTGFKSLNIPHGDNALAAAASSLSQTKA